VRGWPDEVPIQDPRRIDGLFYAARLAEAAYASSSNGLRRSLAEACELTARLRGRHGGPALPVCAPEVVAHRPSFAAASSAPAHFVALDHAARRVLLVTRGAAGPAEAAVMVAAGSTAYRGGTAHTGLLTSGQALWAEVSGTLRSLVDSHPGYSMLCVGHSLGVPAAVMAAASARDEGMGPSEPARAPRAILFAPPAFVSPDVKPHLDAFSEALVCGEDFVPRINLLGLERLRARLKAAQAMTGGGDLAGMAKARDAAVAAANVAGASAAAVASQAMADSRPSPSATAAAGVLAAASASERPAHRHGLGDALTRYNYVCPGRLVFLRPARWYDSDAPVSPGPRLVEFPHDLPSRTVRNGEPFCGQVPSAMWQHADLSDLPQPFDRVLGDLILTDSMLTDHLVSRVAEELADHAGIRAL